MGLLTDPSSTKEIGAKIREVTGEKRSTFFLLQNISMAIQRGNAACIIGTVPVSEGLDEVFEFVENNFSHLET